MTLAFLILGNLIATEAFAEPQPLTRADCEAASGWVWNETANVCDVNTKAMAKAVKPQPPASVQCERGGGKVRFLTALRGGARSVPSLFCRGRWHYA
jgi:hypothetical protein